MISKLTAITPEYMKHRIEEETEQYIQEIERLKKREQECIDHYLVQCKYASEMESKYIYANYVINELEKHLQNEISKGRSEDNVWLMGCYDEDREILDKLQELKGDSSND